MAKSTIDKVISMFIPVTAYAAIGFEHSIANMYFIIFALLLVTLNYSDMHLHMSTIIKKLWKKFDLIYLLLIS